MVVIIIVVSISVSHLMQWRQKHIFHVTVYEYSGGKFTLSVEYDASTHDKAKTKRRIGGIGMRTMNVRSVVLRAVLLLWCYLVSTPTS